MVDKVFGADFIDDTTPSGTDTVSVNQGAALADVALQDLYKAFPSASIQTLLDLISATQGVILYHNGTDWVALSPGTSGQYLKTLGAGANPAWDTPQGSADGWTASANTWSYSSADAPSFVISIDADVTAVLQPGDRIKLTQTTVKYFIVTAVGSFSGGATLVTVYGGTDYTLANAAITSPYYSHSKAPFGFPLTPSKWSVTVTDTTSRTQASPTQNTWYNLGTTACQITIPIGSWKVSYSVYLNAYIANGASNAMAATLSTANNTESDATMTTQFEIAGATAVVNVIGSSVYRERALTLATKTLYYLNGKTKAASMNNITFANDQVGMVITALCAYL